MDYVKHNSNAWDNEVKEGNQWTKEVSKEIIERAKKGEWGIFIYNGNSLKDILFWNFMRKVLLDNEEDRC